jgi:hypothetical protein
MLTRLMRPAVAGVAVAALLAAGCGDDDTGSDTGSDEAATDEAGPAGADIGAYCEASLAIETAPEPDIDFENASPDEFAAGFKDWAATVMRPLADDYVAVAPDELADDAAVASAAVDEMAETGDFEVWDDPEVQAATDRMHAYDLDSCGWTEVPVTTTDYEFDGLSDGLSAGTTSFELTNDGNEAHEIVLMRRNEGVTMPVEELLELPDEEAEEMVTFVGVIGPTNPGTEDYGVVDLAAGDYIALCFIPTGAVDMFAEDMVDGPPHFVHGMVTEFTVT